MHFFLNLDSEHLESVIYLFIYLFLWQYFSNFLKIFFFQEKKLEKRNLSNVKTCFSRKKIAYYMFEYFFRRAFKELFNVLDESYDHET
jgi:hypothetical protein